MVMKQVSVEAGLSPAKAVPTDEGAVMVAAGATVLEEFEYGT